MEPQIIELDGYRVNHVETGAGEAVILVHGLGGSWRDWQAQIQALEPSYRVCAIDLPGFGMSPPPAQDKAYTMVEASALIRRLMEAKGYPRAFLMGNSMGGGIVLRCALDFPEQVTGVVLANGAGLGREVSGFNRILAFPGAAWLAMRLVSEKMADDIVGSLFLDPAKIPPALVERTWEWLQKAETKQFLAWFYPHALSVWGQEHILLPELKNIRCPVLITWGLEDEVLPVKHAIKGYQAMPLAQLHLIRDCGHVPQIEQADEFTGVAQKFLAEIPL